VKTLRHFEWFVAARYLRAKRKQAVISVITVISVIGVAAGVLAMVVALAINAGFRETLEKNLLGATAHVSILEKQPGEGIAGWRALASDLAELPHVRGASPGLYGSVFLNGPLQSSGAILKGVAVDRPPALEALARLKEGAFARLAAEDGLPGIVLGSRLAQATGMTLDAVVQVISPQGELTPFGPRPSYHRFRVVGIFESGFFDLDSAWAFTSLGNAQRVLSLPDVVNTVELSLDDVHAAEEVARLAEARIGDRLGATTWGEQNGQILNALRMERIVTAITIGLIQLVAALNILITLVMMVMEKHRDIAVLLSMGAQAAQIRRIFVLKGLMIGLAGTAAGFAAAYPLCYFAGRYRWIRLDEQIYALSYVPFAPRWSDGVWIAAAALGVSVLATLYPARRAARILPAEALRYE
jgi:lipoprotein-releasing system permease protein